MAAEEPAGALADLLNEARARGFVGRAAQLDRFDDALRGASGTRILLVHGPGGIGKSTLLDAFARHARRAGRTAAYLDARDVPCSAAAVTAALAADPVPDVLLIDGYELLEPLDRWFREELLPTRPADSVTVLAGRTSPGSEWRVDPGWRHVVRVEELSGLGLDESIDLLARRGVEQSRRGAMAALARGHPLVLAMLAETRTSGLAPAELAEEPDMVARLCGALIDVIPDEAHRAGLAVCAHATRMTHDLLAHTVGDRADEVWDWLESLPYAHRGATGLFLHDVVREVFEAEFAHRAPEAYTSLHGRIKSYFLARLVDPREPHPARAAMELLLLHRRTPLAESARRLRDAGLPDIDIARAGPGDHEEILRLIEHGEGAESAALGRAWLRAQPRTAYQARADDGVVAFAMQVYLPAEPELDAADPVTTAIREVVDELGPLRPGERINVNRFAGSSGDYQRHPMVLLVNGVSSILEWALEPAAWTFIVTLEDALYGPYFEYLGLSRLFTLDYFGRPLSGYGWDRRRFPPESFFELMARRELSGESGPPPAGLLRPAPLSRDAFGAAVHDALRQYCRLDRLAESPLLGTALADPQADEPALALQRLLAAAAGELTAEPRGADHRRVLERTYLKGSPSQEAAADLLGLPFSTYRRHLAHAEQRLIEALWSVEVGQVRRPPDTPEMGSTGDGQEVSSE